MLHPTLQTADAMDALRARWHNSPCLRVSPFLREDMALAILDALRPQPFTLIATVSATLSFQYWSFGMRPEDSCDHVLCKFGRWLWTDGASWLSTLTGMQLGPPADRVVQSSLYTRGCYLDIHNDYNGARQVAFILGLTPPEPPDARPQTSTRTSSQTSPETGPQTDRTTDPGGHLEFWHMGPHGAELVERRPPGWNTLDIFDVRAADRLHRVPLVIAARERRAISGWFYQPSE